MMIRALAALQVALVAVLFLNQARLGNADVLDDYRLVEMVASELDDVGLANAVRLRRVPIDILQAGWVASRNGTDFAGQLNQEIRARFYLRKLALGELDTKLSKQESALLWHSAADPNANVAELAGVYVSRVPILVTDNILAHPMSVGPNDGVKLSHIGYRKLGPPPPLPSDHHEPLLRFDTPLNGVSKISLSFWEEGFTETVLIAVKGRFSCTGTIVGKWVVTAAHCVGTGQGLVRPAWKTELSILRARSGGTAAITTPPGVVPSGTRSGLEEVSIDFDRPPSLHPDWTDPYDYPHDVALIGVKGRPGTRGAILNPNEEVQEGHTVTLAGYGWNPDPSELALATQVGWQRLGKLDISSTTPEYSSNLLVINALTGSSNCSGDSGGPVFIGIRQGYRGEAAKLVAVMSSAIDCESSISYLVNLTAEPIRKWICSHEGLCSGRPVDR